MMEGRVPGGFVEITKDEFDMFLSNVCWFRDAFCSVIYYYQGPRKDWICSVRNPLIGAHRETDNTFWVDPSFQQCQPKDHQQKP